MAEMKNAYRFVVLQDYRGIDWNIILKCFLKE
jgi:hypothetical protein